MVNNYVKHSYLTKLTRKYQRKQIARLIAITTSKSVFFNPRNRPDPQYSTKPPKRVQTSSTMLLWTTCEPWIDPENYYPKLAVKR